MAPAEDLPEYTSSDAQSDKGVRVVDRAVGDKLGWIFREQPKRDVGIDAVIELVREGRATGRMIAVQIKSGASYLDERTADGFVYRGESRHVNYWLNHALPVVVVLVDPVTEIAYWAEVTAATMRRTGSGWKVVIPEANRLDESASAALTGVAARPTHKDIIELLLFRFLYEAHGPRIRIASIIETPRDYQALAYVAHLDDRLVMIDLVYLPLEGNSRDVFAERVKWRDYNIRGTFLADVPLILFVVSDAVEDLALDEDVRAYLDEERVELRRLLYRAKWPLDLDEIHDAGNTTFYWGDGTSTTWDDPQDPL